MSDQPFVERLVCGRATCACAKTAATGNGLTHCVGPSHARGDQDPSLSVTTRDGKVLWNCKAGCSNDNVLQALKERGLWGTEKRERRVVATYDYVDRDGTLLYQVVRYG